MASSVLSHADSASSLGMSSVTALGQGTPSRSSYTIDENTRTQTVVINPNDTQSLYFYNAPIGGLELVKVNAADETQRIPNTTFEIRRVSDGGLVDMMRSL